MGVRETGSLRLVDVYEATEAEQVLWRLLKERSEEDDPYVNISHRKMPTRAEHRRFIDSRPYAAWFLVEFEGEDAGYVSLTRRNEIGIILFRKYRGKGLGRRAVKELMSRVRPLPAVPSERRGEFIANVNPKNERSIRMFTKLGFRKIQETYSYDS